MNGKEYMEEHAGNAAMGSVYMRSGPVHQQSLSEMLGALYVVPEANKLSDVVTVVAIPILDAGVPSEEQIVFVSEAAVRPSRWSRFMAFMRTDVHVLLARFKDWRNR